LIISFNILPQTERVNKVFSYTHGVITVSSILTDKVYGRGYFNMYAKYDVEGGHGGHFTVQRKSTGTVIIFDAVGSTMDNVDGFIALFDTPAYPAIEPLKVSVSGELTFLLNRTGQAPIPTVDVRTVPGVCFDLEDQQKDWDWLVNMCMRSAEYLKDSISWFTNHFPGIPMPPRNPDPAGGGWGIPVPF
jgi:hypothetical protein